MTWPFAMGRVPDIRPAETVLEPRLTLMLAPSLGMRDCGTFLCRVLSFICSCPVQLSCPHCLGNLFMIFLHCPG